jgi:hypothetical protein
MSERLAVGTGIVAIAITEAVMRAVTADTLAVPRVPAAALGDTERELLTGASNPGIWVVMRKH